MSFLKIMVLTIRKIDENSINDIEKTGFIKPKNAKGIKSELNKIAHKKFNLTNLLVFLIISSDL